MSYITRQLKIGKTERLDFLAREAGNAYSETLVKFWRVFRRKNHWLSKYAMMRWVRNSNLHAQTVQGCVDTFFKSFLAYRAMCKTDLRAQPPRRRCRYQAIPYKSGAIRVLNGYLILSNGRGNEPLVIPWKFDKPKYCVISYNGLEYVLNATYKIADTNPVSVGECAGIDLGEIHPAVVDTGSRVVIANGRELRSKRRYQNKAKASFQSALSKCKEGSRKWKQLNEAKKRTLKKLDNQIKDIVHKQTTSIVKAMKEDGVRMVGIGDLRNVRKNADNGRFLNQKVHQMPVGVVRKQISYKARHEGMTVGIIDEKYSSQTCPRCNSRNKISTRNYNCSHCGFAYHRDAVGAVNIRNKVMYREYVPVVGDMTPPVGIRYYANTSCNSAV